MKYPWFRAKKFGLGWYPASWQGWVVFAVYLLMLIPLFVIIDSKSYSASDTLISFSLPFIGVTALLLALCYVTGKPSDWSEEIGAGEISPEIRNKAPRILEEVNKAHHVLLHCHVSPDPDSTGSALAMKFALEQLGKKVTVIKGDSDIPEAFKHFPGAHDIVEKNFFEIQLSDFDLFIILDSSSLEMVSRKGPVEVSGIKTVVIDHHISNKISADVILLEPAYPATGQVLFDLFTVWGVTINQNIATNVYMGIYTDTGGFKYTGTTPRTLSIAAELAKQIPNLPDNIARMENTRTPKGLQFFGKALATIEEFCDGKLAIAQVPYEFLAENQIPGDEVGAGEISSFLRTVEKWTIVVAAIEIAPAQVKLSFRTKDVTAYDVSKITVALGGGGHKAAAGAFVSMSLPEVKKAVVAKAKEIYNL